MVAPYSGQGVKRQRRDYSGNEWITLKAFCVPYNRNSPGVTIHPHDLNTLHTNAMLPNWVKIHDCVFKVNCDASFPIGSIGLSQYDFEKLHINDYTPQIMVKLHHAGHENKPMVKSIGFKVKYIPSDNSDTPVSAYSGSHMLSRAAAAIYGQFFTENQEFCFPTANGMLEFKVTSLSLRNEIAPDPFTLQLRVYGCVNERADISFTTPLFSSVRILKEYTSDYDATFHFTVKKFEKTPTREYGEPMLLHEEILSHLILLNYRNTYLYSKKTFKLSYLPVTSIDLTLNKIRSSARDDINDCFVRLDLANTITFGCSASKARIVTGKALIPEAVKVKILSAAVFSLDGKSRKPAWIVVDDLVRSLKGVQLGFVKDQLWSFPIPGGSTTVKIIKIYKDDQEVGASEHYMIDDTTDVEFYADDALKVPLVDTKEAFPLRSIKFEVSAPEWVSNVGMNYYVVSKAIDGMGFTTFAKNQKNKVTIAPKTYPFTVEVSSASFDPKLVSTGEVRYGILGTKTTETQMEVVAKSQNLAIVKKTTAEILADPSAYLSELGIGGVSKKCMDYLVNVVLANGVARHNLSDLKIKPPRGILLYGPPGTGKTTLARVIGDFLGIPNSRITHVDAPNLLNKWRGESERMIKELFDNAKDASDAQGPNAPVHLIIIDEIDAIASKRGGSSSHDTVVNALLSGLSGLKTASNFFVIGTTNQLELIDDAVKRPGRLYPHIAIGVPDLAGRKQIFEIHLKQLREDGLLADDVTVAELAEITEDFTGAEIEGLIQQVVGEALPMAYKKDDAGVEVFNIESIKITMKKFTTAIKSSKHYEDKANAPWRTLYN